MNYAYLQQPQKFAKDYATRKYSRKQWDRRFRSMQVSQESRNGLSRASAHTSSSQVYNQVPSRYLSVEKQVKTRTDDRFMQLPTAAFPQERDELVGKPYLMQAMPIFEGTINNQEVNIDTVQYAENFINATLNASQYGQPNTDYILSIGIKLHDTQWTHLSIGTPVYVYNIKRFKYDGDFILALPNSPYKSDFVNLTNFHHLLKYGTVTLSWNAPTSNFNLKPIYMIMQTATQSSNSMKEDARPLNKNLSRDHRTNIPIEC